MITPTPGTAAAVCVCRRQRRRTTEVAAATRYLVLKFRVWRVVESFYGASLG